MAEKTSERCVLCLDEKRSPVRITCGHSFCNECLDVYKSYQKYAWANRCPICRGSLKDKRRSVKKPLTMTSTSTTITMNNTGGTTNTTTVVTNSSNSNSNDQAPVIPNVLGGATLASPSTVPIEQIYLLEEFMAIATQEQESSSEDEYYSDDDDDQDDLYYFNDDVVELDDDEEDADLFEDDSMDHSDEEDDDVVTLDDVIIID